MNPSRPGSSSHNEQNEQKPEKTEIATYFNACWTVEEVNILLKLYEAKLEKLQTPMKKRRIFKEVADNLRKFNVIVTPAEVHREIDALTLRYRLEMQRGCPESFLFHKEMDNIYALSNIGCDMYSVPEYLSSKNTDGKVNNTGKSIYECKAKVQMKKKAKMLSPHHSNRLLEKIQFHRLWLKHMNRAEMHRLSQLKKESQLRNNERIERLRRALESKDFFANKNQQKIEE